MIKCNLARMVDYPVHTAVLVMDVALLIALGPPLLLSVLMVGALLWLTIFFTTKSERSDKLRFVWEPAPAEAMPAPAAKPAATAAAPTVAAAPAKPAETTAVPTATATAAVAPKPAAATAKPAVAPAPAAAKAKPAAPRKPAKKG